MRTREIEKAKELAEEHWLWLEKLLHKIFVDAFTHGYKHAREVKGEAIRDTKG